MYEELKEIFIKKLLMGKSISSNNNKIQDIFFYLITEIILPKGQDYDQNLFAICLLQSIQTFILFCYIMIVFIS